jgi:hypothetical protein
MVRQAWLYNPTWIAWDNDTVGHARQFSQRALVVIAGFGDADYQ